MGKDESDDLNEYGWPKCPPNCEGCTSLTCYGPNPLFDKAEKAEKEEEKN